MDGKLETLGISWRPQLASGSGKREGNMKPLTSPIPHSKVEGSLAGEKDMNHYYYYTYKYAWYSTGQQQTLPFPNQIYNIGSM